MISLVRELSLESDIEFVGEVLYEKIVGTFNSFNIAVFPSLQESFGVATEAQAFGIPVIATNIDGLPEATDKNKSAILVDSKNVE